MLVGLGGLFFNWFVVFVLFVADRIRQKTALKFIQYSVFVLCTVMVIISVVLPLLEKLVSK